MPARAPAPHPARDRAAAREGRARGADPLRRRRGCLHRRSFLHPSLGLPVADREAEQRSAAHRSGGARQQRLRRLRRLRRGGARRGAVPVLLQGRHRPEPEPVRPRARGSAAARDRLARRRGASRVSADRPITILIAALGGEGGGVLADWLVDAATAEGFPVQSTSIPGVAQRTGATTYYIEIFPARADTLGGRVPVLALTPNPGNIDVMVASELIEAGRAMQNGYVSPERTTLVASTHRIYAIAEKIAMTDGRFDSTAVTRAAEELAKWPVLRDFARVAQEAGSVINAVLFGAVASTGALPFGREACEAAIRRSGKGVESSLRGFAAGFSAARGD